MNKRRAVLTIAVGKPVYLYYASNLARSFHYWHPDDDIEFHLVTDSNHALDPDLNFVHVHGIDAGHIGQSFTSKLHIDQFLDCDETLFIDADCLCAGHLGFVFEKFEKNSFSLIGEKVSEGELFGDIAFRCRKIGVPWTVRFCGSVYFFRKGKKCSDILAYARELEMQYEELGLVKLRGVPNEEPLLGLAMAKFGEEPIADDGTIKTDLMFYNGSLKLDVFGGVAEVSKGIIDSKLDEEWNIPVRAQPKLVHFNASWTQLPPYTSQSTCMRLVGVNHWPKLLAIIYVKLLIEYPHTTWSGLKNILRKPYHFLFGYRKVQRSDRL